MTQLLGREPRAEFDVVVRSDDGEPAVIRNAPLLADGTPMPTRYWLVAPKLVRSVSRLEADGGVRAATAAIDPEVLAAAHAEYASERAQALPAGWTGPEPFGGVGGTRQGVKCLHAHYAWFLAGARIRSGAGSTSTSSAIPGNHPREAGRDRHRYQLHPAARR